MRSPIEIISVMAVTASMVGCVSRFSEATPNVAHGDPKAAKPDFVVALSSEGGPCTGSILRSDSVSNLTYVLTAAHCGNENSFVLNARLSGLGGTDSFVSSIRSFPHESFRSDSGGVSVDNPEFDIAIAVFPTDRVLGPIRKGQDLVLGRLAPSLEVIRGIPITLHGFGSSTYALEAGTEGVYRQGRNILLLEELKKTADNGTNVVSFSSPINPGASVPLGEQSGIISGDSGGPVVADDRIIAINVAGGVADPNSKSAVSLVLLVTTPSIRKFLTEVSTKENLKLAP